MQFIRKSTLAVCAALFTISIFWLVLLLGFQRMLASPGNLKQALKESGIYNTVVNDVLIQAQKEQTGRQGESGLDIPVDDARIRSSISDAFPPPYLQSQTESVLDSSFAWLEGRTPSLAFAVDVSDAKVRLADNLAAYARERSATLPPCPAGTPPAIGSDIFKAACLPPGTDANSAAEQARNQILQGELLKSTTISADTIKDEQGKPLSERLKQVPEVYQGIQDTLIVIGVITLLLGAAIVLLSTSRRGGLKKLAIIGIIAGSLAGLFSVLAGAALGAAKNQLQPDGDHLQLTMFKVFEILTNNARNWWLFAGIALIAVGAGALIALHFTKPKQETGQEEKIELPIEEDTIGTAHTQKNNKETLQKTRRRKAAVSRSSNKVEGS